MNKDDRLLALERWKEAKSTLDEARKAWEEAHGGFDAYCEFVRAYHAEGKARTDYQNLLPRDAPDE